MRWVQMGFLETGWTHTAWGDVLSVLIALLVVAGILILPIWSLVLLHKLRARLTRETDRLHARLDRLTLTAHSQPPCAAQSDALPAATPAAAHAPLRAAQPPPLTAACAAPASPVEPLRVTEAARPVRERPPLSSDSSTARILRAAWNWVIVGEAYRRPGVSMEEAVATNWLIRLGVLVLVVGIGFFLKYSIDKGLLGPPARVAMCFVTGAALVGGGTRLFGKRYHLLGQGLVGAGLATLYFAVFAAAGLFHLVPTAAGFVLMAFVTLTAGMLAVRYETALLALLGTLGGYLTPVMLQSATDSLVWLFGYLLLLAVGVTGVAWRKRWPGLTYISFVCHNLIFFQAVHWTAKSCDFATTMPFFAAYFVLYTTAIFIHGASRGQRASSLELAGLFVCAAVFFGGGYELVRGSFSKASVAWLTLGMAAYYTGHVGFFLRRAAQDRGRLAAFLGLAAGSLALTLPLVLSRAWLTLSWSVLALVALWVSVTLGSPFLRGIALSLYCFVAAKLSFLDLARAYDVPTNALADYGPRLLDRAMQFGVPIVSFWLAFRLLSRAPRGAPAAAPHQPNRPHGGAWGVLALVGMYGLLFLVLNLEVYRFYALIWAPGQLPALTLIWVAFGFHLVARRERLSAGPLSALLCIALIGLCTKILGDIGHWQPEFGRAVYAARHQNCGGWVRLADVGAVIGFLEVAWVVCRNIYAVRGWALACGYAALALAFLHFTLETGTFFERFMPGFRGGAVSVFWALYAFALIIAGIRWQVGTLRYLGLGLFAVVVAKVFLVDLDYLASIYRIAALVVLGVVMLLAAFVYLKQPRKPVASSADEGLYP